MENKFLNSINIMKQRGEISEEAFLKITELYNKEKEYDEQGFWERKSTVDNFWEYKNKAVNKNQNYNKPKQKIAKQVISPKINQSFSSNNKPVKTKEEQVKEIKERNITTILSAGIILILLAGLILATSTWDLMSNAMKTSCLFMISALFFGMSIFTEKKLKIEKTSFSFWILGNLFLPIILLSIGYFRLFGNYLSIGGTGKYIFGIMCSIICLPFYIYSIKKYKYKCFVWISLIDISLFYWFILRQIGIKGNLETLMMLIYACILTLIYHKFKIKQGTYAFVVENIKNFSIINLILNAIVIEGKILSAGVSQIIGKSDGGIEDILLVIGMLILAGNIIYWSYNYKFNGSILVIGTLIIATHIMCFTLNIYLNQFSYYFIMYLVLLSIYSLFYYWNDFEFIRHMKFGSDIIVLTLMGVLALISTTTLKDGYIGILLYILLMILYVTSKKAKDKDYIKFLKISIPIILFVANQFVLTAAGLIKDISNDDKFHIGLIFIIFNLSIIYGISVILKKIKSDDYKIYYHVGHVFLIMLYFYMFECQLDRILIESVMLINAVICLYLSKSEKKIKSYLFGLITVSILLLFELESLWGLNSLNINLLENKNLFLCISIILNVIWYFAKEEWKERLTLYVISIYSLGLLSSVVLNEFENPNVLLICIVLICIISMNIFLHKSNKNMLSIIPLGSLWIMNLRITNYFDDLEKILMNYLLAIVLILVGYSLCFYFKKLTEKEVRYYNGFAGLSLLCILFLSSGKNLSYVYGIVSLIACGAFAYYLSIFTEKIKLKKGLIIMGIFLYYLAYSKFIINLEILKKLELELVLAPSIWGVKLINDKYISKENSGFKTLLGIWYSLVGVILLIFNPQNNDFHAIIFGALCIFSIIIGFIIQSRLYFIGGITFLIIGVFLNTLSFWLSIPWWIYLLAGGIILITFASKNELNKGKSNEKKENLKDKFLRIFEKWK